MIQKSIKTILILSLSLFADTLKEPSDIKTLDDKTIKLYNDIKIIDDNINILQNKTKKDYEKKQNLLQPVQSKDTPIIEKEDDITLDSNVDFNKSTKSVDGVKLNLGKKF